ncbi:glycerol-3-phosphate dehydrogenase [Mycoplasmopsis agassizii]|uniref:Glycerol-3-phosphate dehydrogenase n=2 Tax=Mycoplasmopsis agassizii TaxID=33922 RepID=A0A269TIK9_9BACT|nr:glycerol-3-phosphate dehydrogenase [Mycoplasmopsis agassizii]
MCYFKRKETMDIQDIAIIGGGIIGGAIAYQLSRYDVKIITFEKNPVLAGETSTGNSGALHGGFDPEPHKIEAKLNVLGVKIWKEQIFKHLKFNRAKIPTIVLAFNDEEAKHLHMLYERGITNKVPKEFLSIIDKDEIIKLEPNVNKDVVKALVYWDSYAIDPVQATHAFFAAATNNGLTIKKNSLVTGIKDHGDYFEITVNGGEKYYAKTIINAAGHYADVIAEKAGYPDFKQTTRRGEYRILARSEAGVVRNILFMVPTIHGKGVLVAPTLDGHVLVGPTAEEGVAKEDTRLITREKYDYIGAIGNKIIPSLRLDKTSISLSGSRPIDIATNDFVINHAKANKRFINAAGMQSPAIASAPAIALEIEKLVKNAGLELKQKSGFKPDYEIFF